MDNDSERERPAFTCENSHLASQINIMEGDRTVEWGQAAEAGSEAYAGLDYGIILHDT
jgi:hypothetical protein